MNELINVNEINGELTVNQIDKYVKFEEQLKKAQDFQKDFKKKLLNEMKEKGIKSIKNDKVTITLKDGTLRETFDKKTFKEEHPDMYDEYIKFSNVKESLMVKLKK